MTPSFQLALALLLGGLFVLVLEMFIPSAGVLFLIASVCIVGSVFVAFSVGTTLGWTFLVVVVILAMILPWLGFEVWKRSPIGRRMLLDSPAQPSTGAAPAGGEETATARGELDFSSLRGQIGKTLTPLRPAGTTEIMGRRVDTVAQGVMIDRGEYVRVVEVQGNRIVVRKLDPEEMKLDAPGAEFE